MLLLTRGPNHHIHPIPAPPGPALHTGRCRKPRSQRLLDPEGPEATLQVVKNSHDIEFLFLGTISRFKGGNYHCWAATVNTQTLLPSPPFSSFCLASQSSSPSKDISLGIIRSPSSCHISGCFNTASSKSRTLPQYHSNTATQDCNTKIGVNSAEVHLFHLISLIWIQVMLTEFLPYILGMSLSNITWHFDSFTRQNPLLMLWPKKFTPASPPRLQTSTGTWPLRKALAMFSKNKCSWFAPYRLKFQQVTLLQRCKFCLLKRTRGEISQKYITRISSTPVTTRFVRKICVAKGFPIGRSYCWR